MHYIFPPVLFYDLLFLPDYPISQGTQYYRHSSTVPYLRYNTAGPQFYLKQQIFPLFFLYRLNIPVQRHFRQYKVFPVPSQGNLPYSDPEHNTSGLQAVFHTEYSSNLPAQPLESQND